MTIKELEERIGMTRANIRFYEEEGLLKPKRLPNGYRDYSEEDILTLEKISLLRQLHLDINTIRLVQDGQLTLEQALFSQRSRLEGDRVVIDRALDVCKRLEQSRVEYAALEPKAWLQELKQPARPELNTSSPPPLSEEERYYRTHRAYEHPWMRYFARTVDIGIYNLVINIVAILIFRAYGITRLSNFEDWLLSLGALVLSFLLEPLWLHYWGWTPGKWIFGLKLRDKDGNKLSLGKAWDRSWRVAWEGCGLLIPIYSLWRLYKSYRCYRNDEDCYWDIYEDFRYTCEGRRLYGLWWAGEEIVSFAVVLLLVAYTYMPVNRGGLTVEEFAENYNMMLEVHQLTGADKLDSDGTWEDPEPGVYVVDISETEWEDPVYTLEDGEINSVTFHTSSTGTLLSDGGIRFQIAVLAFAGTQSGLNMFDFFADNWADVWTVGVSNGSWQDFDVTYQGVRMTRTVEMQGYENVGSYWAALEGQDHFCTQTVTISLVGSEE